VSEPHRQRGGVCALPPRGGGKRAQCFVVVGYGGVARWMAVQLAQWLRWASKISECYEVLEDALYGCYEVLEDV
jgi:hypothetical protein